MNDADHPPAADGLRRLSRSALSTAAKRLGLQTRGPAVLIPFFDQVYRVEPDTILSSQGHRPTDAVAQLLRRYLLACPSVPEPEAALITFRELAGAGPLVSSFVGNTNKLITSAFASHIQALERACLQFKGRVRLNQAGYDLHAQFQALPGIFLQLQFNATDEQFPAQCSLLFNPSAGRCLDMHDLFILGTYLAGGLVGAGDAR
jgi:hypothetical protein